MDYCQLYIFIYPGVEKVMLMKFVHDYRSNNLIVVSRKELFWRKTNANWQIVYEGNRTFPTTDNTVVKN